MEEDLLIRFFRDPQTNEFLIAGAGQPHIEAIVSRLKKRYHAEVTLKAPKVPYRETIRAKAEAPGPPQEADRRPRPVRRLQNPHGAPAARRRLRVRQRSLRRRHPPQLHPRHRKGHRRVSRPRLSRRLPGRRLQGRRLRRQLPRRRLQRNVLQDGRPPRLPQGHGTRPSPAFSSPS